MREQFKIAVGGGTPGADSNTYKLFDSTTAFGVGVLPTLGVSRVMFDLKNNQAGTLNAYRSTDGGTNWDLYDSRAVPASGAGVVAGPFDYLVDGYLDWKLEWVNGGSAQTTWRPGMIGIVGDRTAAGGVLI